MTEAPGTSAPTVDEIRRFALPAGTELVGGVTGLARPVFWVRVAQLEQSSLGRIESGDLVLLAGPAAGRPGRHSALANLLSRLAELGAAGVVTMTGVPPGAGVIANAIGIPLLKLPSGSRLHDIEKRTIALIINRQAEIEQRGVQIYRELAQQAIDNLGIEAIAEKLVELTGKAGRSGRLFAVFAAFGSAAKLYSYPRGASSFAAGLCRSKRVVCRPVDGHNLSAGHVATP